MILKKQLGRRIQNLRRTAKITQETLAEIIGIDPKNVSRIENGNSYPSSETITAIAKALNVDIYELFIFEKKVPLDVMKQEVINALADEKKIIYLYEMLSAF